MTYLFERTTILPTDDKALSRELFRHLVYEEARVLCIVLGKGDDDAQTAERADRAAKTGLWRWVCWARRPEHLQEDVAALQGAGDLGLKLPETRLFTTSFGDDVRDRLERGDPAPSIARVMLAFARAEK